MIVEPTVQDLLKHAENRYALVIAVSKRAREIAKEQEERPELEEEKSPVTIAAKEFAEGKISIKNKGE